MAGLLVLAATAPTLAGGEAGAGLQFGAALTFKPDFYWLTDEKYVAGTGGLWPTAWLHMPWGTRLALFVLVFCLLLGQIARARRPGRAAAPHGAPGPGGVDARRHLDRRLGRRAC